MWNHHPDNQGFLSLLINDHVVHPASIDRQTSASIAWRKVSHHNRSRHHLHCCCDAGSERGGSLSCSQRYIHLFNKWNPRDPSENGFMEPKCPMRFGGDEGHPKVIIWEYDGWFLGFEMAFFTKKRRDSQIPSLHFNLPHKNRRFAGLSIRAKKHSKNLTDGSPENGTAWIGASGFGTHNVFSFHVKLLVSMLNLGCVTMYSEKSWYKTTP